MVESDLSPIAAEYRPIWACLTQNKAKRANKIVFLLLIRDQEVGGSNPLAPTTFLQTNQTVTETSCSGTASNLGSLGSIETNEAGTSKPTPQRFHHIFAERHVILNLVVGPRHALAAPTKPEVKNAVWAIGTVFKERVTETAKPVVPGPIGVSAALSSSGRVRSVVTETASDEGRRP